jgi:hypothetical protein
VSGVTLADVLDVRAYERVREEYRARVMARKRLRRIALGPFMTVVFECFDTVRFQVQEMARVEKLISDEAVQSELDIYNTLLPAPGQLSATLFIELTSEEGLRDWLPRLVGIEQQLGVDLGDQVVPSMSEEQHAAALTRPSVTSAVHYVRIAFADDQVERFRSAREVALVATHGEYAARTLLAAPVREELLGDLLGTTKRLALA